ncbi:tRNA dihydrouridine synthase DusB, partial [Staphylococcus agnetis]
LGNPWMIYRTVHYLETGELIDEPEVDDKVEIALLHLRRLVDLKGEKVGVMEMRKHASWYLKGVRGNGKARKALNQAETEAEMIEILTEFRDEMRAQQNKVEA